MLLPASIAPVAGALIIALLTTLAHPISIASSTTDRDRRDKRILAEAGIGQVRRQYAGSQFNRIASMHVSASLLMFRRSLLSDANLSYLLQLRLWGRACLSTVTRSHISQTAK
jgi:hypothetical protein